jgi:hypothetical protein
MKSLIYCIILTSIYLFTGCQSSSTNDNTSASATKNNTSALSSENSAIEFVEGGDSGPKIKLKFNPASPSKKTILMKMDLSSEQLNMVMEMDAEMNVKSKTKEGNFIVSSTYKRVAMDMDVMGQNVQFDTDKESISSQEEVNELKNKMKYLLNTPVEMVLNQQAGIEKAPDFTEIVNKMNLPGQSPEQFNQMFDNLFAIYPNQEISVGDAWYKTIKTSTNAGPLKIKAKYLVKSITTSEINLALSGDLTGDLMEAGQNVQVSGEMQGFIIVDAKDGWTKKVEIIQDMNLSNGGQDMKMTQKIDIDIK